MPKQFLPILLLNLLQSSMDSSTSSGTSTTSGDIIIHNELSTLSTDSAIPVSWNQVFKVHPTNPFYPDLQHILFLLQFTPNHTSTPIKPIRFNGKYDKLFVGTDIPL